MLYIENELDYIFDFKYKSLAEKIVTFVLKEEGCKYDCDISLTLTNDEEIHQINLEQRNIDRPTDVLSFPNLDYEKPGDLSFVTKGDPAIFDLTTGGLVLGDIVISVPTMLRQAKEYGHSIKREYAFLITHSMLHLLGYDHMVKDEEKIMFDKQNKYLDKMGITR